MIDADRDADRAGSGGEVDQNPRTVSVCWAGGMSGLGDALLHRRDDDKACGNQPDTHLGTDLATAAVEDGNELCSACEWPEGCGAVLAGEYVATDGGVDRAVRRDEPQRLSSTEGYPIYLHNVGGKEPDGKPTRLGKWTFGTTMVKDVVLDHVDGRVLNACAGKTRLQKRGCEFFRNDIDEDRDADLHVDVREIHQHLEPETFDAAILDPPFDPGRAEKLYEGWHGQEYSNARDAVGKLVCPGGTVVELGWNSWSLSDKDGWEPVEHHIYRQSSFKADVHLTVDRKVNQKRLVTDGGVDQDDGETDQFRAHCYHPQCDKTFDSVNDMVAVAGEGHRSPRHFCEACAERLRRGPPLTDGGRDRSGDEEDHNLLDWWECANCGETGRSSVANCPNCGGMQIGSLTDDFDLPPCWKENSALAAALGVERLWVHLEGPGFIGMQDGEVELVREEIVRGMRPDPEGRPATAENVRQLAETYNDEFYEGVEAGV